MAQPGSAGRHLDQGHGCRATTPLIVLAGRDEVPDGAMDLLRQEAEARRLRMIALPIQDYSVPGEAFLQAWRRLRTIV